MPDLSYPDIVFKSIDSYDDVSCFHSTEQELDDFLHEDALEALSEYSLSEFLENEPDHYSIADLKIRYQ